MTRPSQFPSQATDRSDDADDQDLPKSKSQRKREMTALQDLGAEIEALPKEKFKRVPLPEHVAEALLEARRITNHEGKRRQMQYVGKVMRSLDDGEVAAIRRVLDTFKGASRAETARLHLIERWRDRLLTDDGAMTAFCAEYPDADVQTLRALIRNARREAQLQKPPRAAREIFQMVKTILDAAADDTPTEDRSQDDDAED
ncbi:MAG TPA: ribosome biogenesis factor YjgA [Burkholderiaceae bacterium]|nr:ribosome biogenesis factor YjgA [Burkholderiaceae bacterium]